MRTIPHRELRNDSSRILDEVKNGEVIEVTNHGELVAVLMPPSMSAYNRLVGAGRIRVAREDDGLDLRQLPRRRVTATTAKILDDVRGPVIVYVDASAALKLVVDEDESDAVAEYLEQARGRRDRLVSSLLLHTEMHCAANRRPDDVAAVPDALSAIDLLQVESGDLTTAALLPGQPRDPGRRAPGGSLARQRRPDGRL